MHVRPPRKIDSCSRRHNNGSKLESSADLLFLPRICYSCPDLLFLHRFAQICYSWQNLLFPQSASVKWFQHKGGQLAQIKDSRTIFTIIETFQHLPSYLKFHFQHSKRATAILVGFPLEGAQPSREAPSDDTVWSLSSGWVVAPASSALVADKGGSFPTRWETPGTPWCHPSLQSPFLQTRFLQSSPASKFLPL